MDRALLSPLFTDAIFTFAIDKAETGMDTAGPPTTEICVCFCVWVTKLGSISTAPAVIS